jgi:hypothetical protein
LVDRRLLGILAMAVTISTAVAILLFTEETEERIEVVKNYWQTPTVEGYARLAISEAAVPYTLGLVARRPLEEVLVRFGILRNQTFTVNYTGWEDLSLKERAIRVGGLSFMDSRARDVSESMAVEPIEEMGRILVGEEEYTVLILDYHPYMAALADAGYSIGVPYLFAFVLDDSGNCTQFYSGYWDFFENRLTSVMEITIQMNENITRYANEQNMAEGSLPLSDTLGMLGEVAFSDLKPDDRIFVSYRVVGAPVPGEEAFMQIVRLRVDGGYLRPLVNILKR